MNLNYAKLSLGWLKGLGVEEILLCAGARNATLVYALEDFNFKVRCFFEERSAGFFALGRMAATQKPVAVITTSGTAVAELLPSVIEAYYQGRPLIVVSADRPRSFRKTGAPQSIEQVGLFGDYVETCLDLEAGEAPKLKSYSFSRPLHLNLCFAEPLLSRSDEKLVSWPLPERSSLAHEFDSFALIEQSEFKNPLVLVSEIPTSTRQSVEDLLRTKFWDCYLEAPSGLKAEGLSSYSNEAEVRSKLKNSHWDQVIRIGSVPTTRIWRDLEDLDLAVWSFSNRPLRGLSKDSAKVFELERLNALSEFLVKAQTTKPSSSASYRKNLEGLFEKWPHSEPAWFHKVFQSLPQDTLLYLGNSLPIREWDLVWDRRKNFEIYSHRGANGIDGQLSGFLGRCEAGRPNVAVLGDLTTLYDLSGFWGHRQSEVGPTQVLVINNKGGQIFSRMFDRTEFLNRHDLNFEALAKMWSWKYQRPREVSEWDLSLSPALIEICPNENQTKEFWKDWELLK